MSGELGQAGPGFERGGLPGLPDVGPVYVLERLPGGLLVLRRDDRAGWGCSGGF